jgi:hypothetical protein
MGLLAGKLYDPAAAVSKATSALLAMTALDTTNLRLTFTVPASGTVMVRLACMLEGATTMPQVLLGVMEGATVRGRMSPMGGLRGTALATTHVPLEAVFLVPGLTPGASLTWDAAYACRNSRRRDQYQIRRAERHDRRQCFRRLRLRDLESGLGRERILPPRRAPGRSGCGRGCRDRGGRQRIRRRRGAVERNRSRDRSRRCSRRRRHVKEQRRGGRDRGWGHGRRRWSIGFIRCGCGGRGCR